MSKEAAVQFLQPQQNCAPPDLRAMDRSQSIPVSDVEVDASHQGSVSDVVTTCASVAQVQRGAQFQRIPESSLVLISRHCSRVTVRELMTVPPFRCLALCLVRD